MKPYYEDGAVVIYHGDCREVLPLVSGALLVTSPPYLEQREYEGRAASWDAVVPPVLAAAHCGQALVNLGPVHRNGEVVTYWDGLIRVMREAGWRLFGWYVWDKLFGLPGDWNGRLAPAHEFIFHFNREARMPNKTEACISYGRDRGGTALRKADGHSDILSTPGPVSPYKIPDSVLRFFPQMERNIDHPAVFPVELPSKLIAAYSDPGESVLDPFAGSGTTLRAAKDLGRKAIGIEIEERYCEIAARRCAQEVMNFERAIAPPGETTTSEPTKGTET